MRTTGMLSVTEYRHQASSSWILPFQFGIYDDGKQVWLLRKINFLHAITKTFVDTSTEKKKKILNAPLGNYVSQSWSIEQAS